MSKYDVSTNPTAERQNTGLAPEIAQLLEFVQSYPSPDISGYKSNDLFVRVKNVIFFAPI